MKLAKVKLDKEIGPCIFNYGDKVMVKCGNENNWTKAYFRRYDGKHFFCHPNYHTEWCIPRGLAFRYTECIKA